MSKIRIDKVKDFNLEHIFECGQCFRWNKENDGSYTGVAFGKVVNMKLMGSDLEIDNADAHDFNDIWREYLDLDLDYGKIKDLLSKKDEAMEKAIKEGYGIRILNQELWETIVSFIISANNNIPRIKACIEALCEKLGEPLGVYKGRERYAFPSPQILANASLDDLMQCKLGYRSRYIIETAKTFLKDENLFRNLRSKEISTQEALETLKKLSGVGPKVANCILLFGLQKRDGFPIDVWMKKVMNYLYGIEIEDVKAMEDFARKNFGDNAGIAQQYLFYFMRNRKVE